MEVRQGLKRFLPLLVIVGAIGLAAILMVLKPKPEEKKSETVPLSVTVEPLIQESIRWSSTFQGEVRAKTSIDLVSEVNGKITSLNPRFTEGGSFDAKEVLLTIEQADYLVALESARAAVAEAKVNLQIETANSDIRVKQWREYKGSNGDAAGKPLQFNYPQVAQAKARLDAAEAQLVSAQLDLDRTKLKIPFAGRVMEKAVGLGQFVSRGTKLGHVFATDQMEIRLPMTDQQLAELQLTMGYRAADNNVSTEQTNATVSTKFGNKQYTWQGRLVSVDASIDSQTRLVYATVEVNDPYKLIDENSIPLVPGFFVDVAVDSRKQVAGLKVPRDALRRDNTIYTVKDGKLSIRQVEVLKTSVDVAILSPNFRSAGKAEDLSLPDGVMVVTSPVPGAYEGMSVKINNAAEDVKDNNEDQALVKGSDL